MRIAGARTCHPATPVNHMVNNVATPRTVIPHWVMCSHRRAGSICGVRKKTSVRAIIATSSTSPRIGRKKNPPSASLVTRSSAIRAERTSSVHPALR